MRVTITGATGFVGPQLVRRFLSDGHAVTALTRNVAAARRTLPVRCECRQWNVRAGPEVEALRDAEAIVHLAGEGIADRPWTPARKQAIRDSRVLGTRNLVRTVAALPADSRPATLISASAIGYYGDRGDEELDEQSPPGTDFLASVCGAWEHEAFAAEQLGMRTAVVRIGVVLGSGGGALRKMLLPFRLGFGGRLGSGRQWMSWIHLEDLVGLFAHVLTTGEARGVFNGVAPQAVTNAEFTAALGHALHRPAVLPVPAFALRLALGEMSTVLLASQRVRPRAAERLGFRFHYPEIGPALGDCTQPEHRLEHEQWVRGQPADVFAFFSDPHNLEKITPDFLRFRVLRSSTRELGAGTDIDYRLSLHGIPVRWRSRIDAWEPNRRFTDVQTRGPYKLWHHTHEFEPYAGGTLIRDRVRYALPLDVLGDLIAGGRVARDLDAIFAFRRQRIEEIF
ncbi:MAG: TIGR01777 family oxidoreductase, partial [Sphingomonadales bacterium]